MRIGFFSTHSNIQPASFNHLKSSNLFHHRLSFEGNISEQKNPPTERALFLHQQQIAKEKRKAQPLLVQALFPLLNDRITPTQMELLEKALAQNPLFQPQTLKKFKTFEQDYLNIIRFLPILSKNAPDYGRRKIAGIIEFLEDPLIRDFLIDLLIEDPNQQVRSEVSKSVQHYQDPARRDELILKMAEDSYDLIQARAVAAAPLLSNPKLCDDLLDRKSKDPHFKYLFEIARSASAIHNPQIRNTVIERIISRHKNSENSQANKQDHLILQLALDSSNQSQERAEEVPTKISKKLLSRIDSLEKQLSLIEKLIKKDTYYHFSLKQAICNIPKSSHRDILIQTLASHPNRNLRGLAAETLFLLNNAEQREILLKNLLADAEEMVQNSAIVTAMGLYLETCKNISKQSPEHHKILNNSLEKILSPLNQNEPFPFQPNEALGVLSLVGILGQDGGILRTQILPQYKQVIEFAKTEINKHLSPNQQPYSNEDIEKIFKNYRNLILFSLTLTGPSPLKFKLTQGINKFTRFLENIKPLNFDDELIQDISKLYKDLKISPYELTQLCEITASFQLLNQLPIVKQYLTQALEKKYLDIPDLGKVYLEAFSKSCDLRNEANSAALEKWNLSYMPVLADAYRNFDQDTKTLLKEVIEATLSNRFEQYLVDPSTEIGQSNRKTAKAYKEKGLNFNNWIQYQKIKQFEVSHLTLHEESNLKSLLDELSGEIIKLMGSQRQSIPSLVDKSLIKQIFQFIKGQGYQFDEALRLTPSTHQNNLRENWATFAKNLLLFLDKTPICSKASESQKQEIQTIRSHLAQLAIDLKQCKSQPFLKTGKFLIKPWDRNPGYDLFQGNYSQCCISINNSNRSAIVEYLTNQGIQIVEIKDENTGKTIANTFLYWAYTKEGAVCLIADNVEIAAQYRDEATTLKIQEELSSYLKEYAQVVTNKKETPVFIGAYYNDIPTEQLHKVKKTIQFIGESADNELYLDSLGVGAWSNITKRHTIKLLQF